jgi:hypothetical protein
MPALALVIIGCTMLLCDVIDDRGTNIGGVGFLTLTIGFVLTVFFYR